MPEISVLMAVYNNDTYVGEAVKSVLNQTVKDFELVIVDDGSTDESFSVINNFDDDRIRIIRNNENIGLTRSLNKGLTHVEGEYIARMDSDDICMPDRLEKQLAYLKAHLDVDVVGSWVEIIGEDAGTIWQYPELHADIHARLLFENQIVHSVVMMRREVLAEIHYDESYMRAQDYDLWVRMVAKGVQLANIQEVLLQYRLHAGQVGSRNEGEQIILADRVRLRELRKLGLGMTKAEMLLHQKISLYQFEHDKRFLDNALDWLLKIKNANKEFRYFDQFALENVLGHYWWRLLKSNQGLGIVAWRMYRQSQFSSYVHISGFELLKFWLYCMWYQFQ